MDLLWNSEPRDKLIYQNGGYRGRCMVRDGIGFHPLSPVIADYQNESVPLISLWQGPHDINSYSAPKVTPAPTDCMGAFTLRLGALVLAHTAHSLHQSSTVVLIFGQK